MENNKNILDGFALLDKILLYYTECERNGKLMHASCEIKQKIADIVCKTQSIDAVEVVRCKDCKRMETTQSVLHWCTAWNNRVKEDSFCSYGERRELWTTQAK